MARTPAVANMFYPGDETRLREELRALLKRVPEPRRALAAVSPHAGYVYSGGVAGLVFSQIRIPDTVVILGPNHRGIGAPIALATSGLWDMPMGPVPIDGAVAEAILSASQNVAGVRDDPQAHVMEHSIEVQIPFLQMLNPGVGIVPIALSHVDFRTCDDFGQALARGIRACGKEVLLVASTDMTHYESQREAETKDALAIARILALDPKGLYDVVAEKGITMCGIVPTAIVLTASKALGAGDVELVKYATSGDRTGDYRQVVGYAGFVIA